MIRCSSRWTAADVCTSRRVAMASQVQIRLMVRLSPMRDDPP
jgi:hypothetical protein